MEIFQLAGYEVAERNVLDKDAPETWHSVIAVAFEAQTDGATLRFAWVAIIFDGENFRAAPFGTKIRRCAPTIES